MSLFKLISVNTILLPFFYYLFNCIPFFYVQYNPDLKSSVSFYDPYFSSQLVTIYCCIIHEFFVFVFYSLALHHILIYLLAK